MSQILLIVFLLFSTIAYADLNNGLIGWWQMDEGSGATVADSTGGGNTASFVNSPTWGAGKIRSSLTFDGINQAGSAAINLSSYTLVTISFWLYWNAFANNDLLALEYVNNSNNQNGILINPNSGNPCTGSFGMFSMGAGGTFVGGCFTRPSSNTWHHYVMLFDRATPNNWVYVDGVLQTLNPQSAPGIPANFANSTLYFMSRGTSSLFGAGKLDDVRLYNRALTVTEVRDLYQIGLQRNHFGGGAIIKDMVTVNN